MYTYFEKLTKNKKKFTDSLSLETEKISIKHNLFFNFNHTFEEHKERLFKTFSILSEEKYKLETFDATIINKKNFSFPQKHPEYPLLHLDDVIISLDDNVKGLFTT